MKPPGVSEAPKLAAHAIEVRGIAGKQAIDAINGIDLRSTCAYDMNHNSYLED